MRDACSLPSIVPRRERVDPNRLLSCVERLGLTQSKSRVTKQTQREAVFQPEFREDLRYWIRTDRKTAVRAFDLIEAIMRDPFVGIGKPEPLKYLMAGAWSRRLTEEH